MNKPITWSYSALTAFETCPRRYYLTKVSKAVQEPQTKATLHGNEVHKALELAVSGQQALPTKYMDYAPIVKRVAMTPGKKMVEQKIGMTRDFKPTTFFARDVWLRAVWDVAIVQPKTAIILDWKTGKPKPDSDQLKLFAATAFMQMPQLEKVKTGFVWLGHERVDNDEFTPDDVPAIWQEFTTRVQRIEHAAKSGDFPPKPSGLCREWCPVGKKLCEFCGG
jgi:hypothetical protein